MRYADINKTLTAALGDSYPDREIEAIGRLVLEHVTGLSWVQIRLNSGNVFIPEQESQISGIVARLEKQEPIQYILGETEFYGLVFRVRSGVLIPRGETEELVEWVLKCDGERGGVDVGPRFRGDDKGQYKGEGEGLRFRGDDKGCAGLLGGGKLRVLDIGCGSGAIAVAIAKNLPDAEVIAADISDDALLLTQENARLNQVTIQTLHLDILSPLEPLLDPSALRLDPSLAPCALRLEPLLAPCALSLAPLLAPCALSLEPFDLILSNPPYIPSAEMISMDRHVVEYEPEIALFVPDLDPLLFYKAIAEFAKVHLNPGGQVFVEIHDRFGEETADVFRKLFSIVELRKDIHGKDRMIRACNG